MSRAYVADHEASHASSAALLDLPVVRLSIAPEGPYDGLTTVIHSETRRDRRKRAQVILAPLLEEHRAPTWPLQTDRTTDERNLAWLAHADHLERGDYERIVTDTRALIATPAYKRLRLAIAHAALTLGPVLDEPVLDRLIGEIAMHDRTLDDELEEVFAHERERERGRAPRPEVKTFRTTWRIPAEPAARRLIDADAQDALACLEARAGIPPHRWLRRAVRRSADRGSSAVHGR